MMDAHVTQALAEDGCYDLLHEGAVIGRLVWVSELSDCHRRRGWWLTIPGQPDELIGRVPSELSRDLARARQRSVSMSLGLAQNMLADRVEGLLDGPAVSHPAR
jgi:hypothetical protein